MVNLKYGLGKIALILEVFRQRSEAICHPLAELREKTFVAPSVSCLRPTAGKDVSTRRPAKSIVAVMLTERQTALGQPIDIWRMYILVAVAPKATADVMTNDK